MGISASERGETAQTGGLVASSESFGDGYFPYHTFQCSHQRGDNTPHRTSLLNVSREILLLHARHSDSSPCKSCRASLRSIGHLAMHCFLWWQNFTPATHEGAVVQSGVPVGKIQPARLRPTDFWSVPMRCDLEETARRPTVRRPLPPPTALHQQTGRALTTMAVAMMAVAMLGCLGLLGFVGCGKSDEPRHRNAPSENVATEANEPTRAATILTEAAANEPANKSPNEPTVA